MTTLTDATVVAGGNEIIRGKPAGFVHDLGAIAGRALRAVPRDVAVVIPPVFIALFFFIVNIATLERLTASVPGLDYTAFQMATAVLLGVTGVSRAGAGVRANSAAAPWRGARSRKDLIGADSAGPQRSPETRRASDRASGR